MTLLVIKKVSSVEKPVVQIKDASIGNSAWYPNRRTLCGIPIDHPRERLNGKLIESSEIVEYIPNEVYMEGPETVETKNTVYKVLNWKVSNE
jgi:hypothetical protein